MTSEWKTILETRAGEWRLPTQGRWNLLFHNNYNPHYSTVNLLWFHNSSKYPGVVTKVFHTPEIPTREFDNLCRIHACAPDWVPRPLHLEARGEYWMLWMEGVPGVQLRPDNSHRPSVLRSLTEMVSSIHCRARRKGGSPNRYQRMVSEPIAALAAFGHSATVSRGCDRLARQISPQWIESLPVIPQHGDLFAGNVLAYQDRWHVIDWESFGTIDLPFYDLFTLLLSLLRGKGATPDRWERSLAKQVPILMESYATVLRLSTANIVLLLPLTLANWFHLQWTDGRKHFAESMYQMIEHYFEHQSIWEKVFVAA
jgi:hypothetical protein